MARPEVNRAAEMEVFVRVVERAGFSAAARTLRLTPSAVSKLVARLEARLDVRLVNRSTRKLQLTPEGAAFYERAVRVLDDLDEAEQVAAAGTEPRGRVRVNANLPFGLHCLYPLIPAFLERYPAISLDIALTDEVVDLYDVRADVALRIGTLRPSRLTARKLGESRMAIVASPAYLDRHGTPTTLVELERHNRQRFAFARSAEAWPLLDDAGAIVTVPVVGNAQVGDGESLRRLTLAGLGIARLGLFHVRRDIAAGCLVPILENRNPGDAESLHAIFLGDGGRLPARIRAFLHFLVENVRVS